MKKYLSRIEKIKKEIVILEKENFGIAPSGTHHKVFLSDRYVIRFRDNNPKLLLREANFLKQLNQPLIPKVLWAGRMNKSVAMIENRLPGKTLDTLWKTLPKTNQTNIIKRIIQFLQYLKTQTKNYIYSVNTSKKYNNFSDYLTDNIKQKIARIKKIKQANKILKDLLSVINKPEIKNLFSNRKKMILVHGDLINHNLLTDGKNLTGVLDWELALYGDSDYDLCRLFYYQECAKAYQEQDTDDSYEADYMDQLIIAVSKSSLIPNKKIFQQKYHFIRSFFYLNALYWAISSKAPEKNIDELIALWNKKGETEHVNFFWGAREI